MEEGAGQQNAIAHSAAPKGRRGHTRSVNSATASTAKSQGDKTPYAHGDKAVDGYRNDGNSYQRG